jgi:hypothetical protein
MKSMRLSAPSSSFTASVPGLPPARVVPGKVRLVKDALRVGKFLCGCDPDDASAYLNVTPETLNGIVANFNAQAKSGLRHPLCWGHGEKNKDIDARNIITDLDTVWTDGETLFVAIYVDPDTHKTLTSERREVSVGLCRDWTDGGGKTWPGQSLLHLAIVSHAAVSGQEPFVQLGAPTAKSQADGNSHVVIDWVKTLKAMNTLMGGLMKMMGAEAQQPMSAFASTAQDFVTNLEIVAETVKKMADDGALIHDPPSEDAETKADHIPVLEKLFDGDYAALSAPQSNWKRTVNDYLWRENLDAALKLMGNQPQDKETANLQSPAATTPPDGMSQEDFREALRLLGN